MAEDKIYYYRGKTVEELKSMSFEEFTSLLPSDLKRKIKRGFTEEENKLLLKIRTNEKNIKTHCRDMIIIPEMIGHKIGVYNGKEFITITITEELLTLRLGELAMTRKIAAHSGAGAKKTSMRK